LLKPDDDSNSDSSEDEHEQVLVTTAMATVSNVSTALQTTAAKCFLWHRAKDSRCCYVATHVSVKAVSTELLIW